MQGMTNDSNYGFFSHSISCPAVAKIQWLSRSAGTFQRQIKHFNLTEIICPSESAGRLLPGNSPHLYINYVRLMSVNTRRLMADNTEPQSDEI